MAALDEGLSLDVPRREQMTEWIAMGRVRPKISPTFRRKLGAVVKAEQDNATMLSGRLQ